MRKAYNDNYRYDVKYVSKGFTSDYSKNNGIESITYRGLMK